MTDDFVKMDYEADPFETGSVSPHYSIVYQNMKLILTSSPRVYDDTLVKVKINNQHVKIETRLKRKASQIPAFIVINPYVHRQGRLLPTDHKIYISKTALSNVIKKYYDNFSD
jgi:uncharacterized protein YpmS